MTPLPPDLFALELEAAEDMAASWRLRPRPVVDWDEERDGSPASMDPIPVSTSLRGEIAEEFAGCFYREAGFDFRPYEAGQEDPGHRDVHLIPSRQVHTLIPLAIGAVEVLTLKDISAVAWVWIHPFERTMSAGRWTQVWQ